VKELEPSDIRNLQDYEMERDEFRKRVIELKKRRRVSLGPLVTLVFENRDTVRFQIQEMLRIERIVQPERVQDEIDTYNSLLPGPGEVAATLFIEVNEESRVKPVLDSFIGLDEGRGLWIEAKGEKFFAVFEAGHGREDKISAVHYIRFPLGDRGRAALESGSVAELVLDFRENSARTELSPGLIAELRKDLAES
jgi:hypothetical protein